MLQLLLYTGDTDLAWQRASLSDTMHLILTTMPSGECAFVTHHANAYAVTVTEVLS